MGDVVGLVEKAAETIDQEEAEKTARRALKGQFTLEDLADQLAQIKKMGDMQGLLGMLPGVGKMKKQIADANIGDKTITHQEAIIMSMTPKERENPEVLNMSRKKRIARGAGVSLDQVNMFIKQFDQMRKMMHKLTKTPGFGGGGAVPKMKPGFRRR